MNKWPRPIWPLLPFLGALAGCSAREESWPPPPRDRQERHLIEAARQSVERYDGWTQVAWVVERFEGQWRVQAWKIVDPKARGRMQCVPWAVRGILFDNDANQIAYRNYL